MFSVRMRQLQKRLAAAEPLKAGIRMGFQNLLCQGLSSILYLGMTLSNCGRQCYSKDHR